MKRTKKLPSQWGSSRVWIGALVLVAIIVVVGVKRYVNDDSAAPVATAPDTPAITGASQVDAEPTAKVPTTTPTREPAATATPSDPYPTNPLEQILWLQRNQKPAMILFHSTNCIPCKQMEALVAKIHEDYEPDVFFVDVITNDSANTGLVREAGIQAIPTTFFVSCQGKAKKAVGAMKEDVLRAQLDLLREGGL